MGTCKSAADAGVPPFQERAYALHVRTAFAKQLQLTRIHVSLLGAPLRGPALHQVHLLHGCSQSW